MNEDYESAKTALEEFLEDDYDDDSYEDDDE